MGVKQRQLWSWLPRHLVSLGAIFPRDLPCIFSAPSTKHNDKTLALMVKGLDVMKLQRRFIRKSATAK